MATSVKPIPDGYHSVIPQLRVQKVDRLIDFLKIAFNAKETERFTMPDDSIAHAVVRLGDSAIMVSGFQDENYRPTYSEFHLYVEDCDSTYKQALEAGATSVMQPADQFYGDRSSEVKDPFGNRWWIDTHIENLSREEISKRMDDYMKKQAQGQTPLLYQTGYSSIRGLVLALLSSCQQFFTIDLSTRNPLN